jgi:hypothetical protein
MSFYLKDPQSQVDYAIEWTGYLDGKTIAASIWIVVPNEAGGIAIDQSGFDLERASARLSGGIEGHSYSVTNRVTLSDGSSDDRSIALRVEHR